MTTDNKCNGWTNWETWNWNLWHDDWFTEQAQECFDNAEPDDTFNKKERATLDLMEQIKATAAEEAEEFQDSLPKHMQSSFFMDTVNMSIREINFYEIAENYIGEIENNQ